MSVESIDAGFGNLEGRAPFPSILSPSDEKRIARELSPPVAWPTLALAVALPVAYAVIAQLGWDRVIPLWACAIVLSPISYAHYTLVHEAVHDNLVPGHRKLRWVNALVGWIGALGLGFNWPLLMRTHVLHHAHTNTDEDPDIIVKGSLAALIPKAFFYNLKYALRPLFVTRLLAPGQYRTTRGWLHGSEALQSDAVTVASLALLVLAIPTGHAMDWVCLFFIPTSVAGILLAILFQWLPHHPFDRTDRYMNTRVSLWPGAELMTLQQNLHLMHHLWPSVPFYNYAALYRRLRPTLIAKGCRIEGLMVGPFAKDRSAA